VPPLPQARYAATMQLWRGRLHVLGGSREDRYHSFPSRHAAVAWAGVATEPAWREELAMPHAVCHHASAVVGDHLYVLGGQRGDFVAVPGSPDYECTGRTQETYSSAAVRLAPGATAWEPLPDLPVAASHTEASVLVLGASIVLIGGQCAKDPMTFDLKLTDAIQVLDTRSRQWRVVGHLPYRVKTAVAGWDRGSVYVVGGQRDAGPSYPTPDAIVSDAWRARLPIDA